MLLLLMIVIVGCIIQTRTTAVQWWGSRWAGRHFYVFTIRCTSRRCCCITVLSFYNDWNFFRCWCSIQSTTTVCCTQHVDPVVVHQMIFIKFISGDDSIRRWWFSCRRHIPDLCGPYSFYHCCRRCGGELIFGGECRPNWCCCWWFCFE